MKEQKQTVNDIRRLRAMRKGWLTIFHESKPGSERDTAFNMIQVLDDSTHSLAGKTVPLSEAKMNGTEILFTANGRQYRGQANGNAMSGAVDGKAWTATRLGG